MGNRFESLQDPEWLSAIEVRLNELHRALAIVEHIEGTDIDVKPVVSEAPQIEELPPETSGQLADIKARLIDIYNEERAA